MEENGRILPPVENQILKLLAQGYTVPAVARRMGKTTRTIKRLQGKIYQKLGAKNLAQAIAQAFIQGEWMIDELSSTKRICRAVPVLQQRGQPSLPVLTTREKQICKLLNLNFTYAKIAAILSIKEGTVKYHTKSIRRKLGVSPTQRAIRLAKVHGLF